MIHMLSDRFEITEFKKLLLLRSRDLVRRLVFLRFSIDLHTLKTFLEASAWAGLIGG